MAAALSLDKVTSTPPVGAAAFKVTVPVEDSPPVTLDGSRVTDDSAGAWMVSVAVWDWPKVPEIVAMVSEATGPVVTVKVAVIEPSATVTSAGTIAAA